MSLREVEIWVDGACSGNPGPSGAGVVLKTEGANKEISEYLGHGTNNTAEFQAAVIGLLALKRPDQCSVTLYSDSALVVNVLNGDWIASQNRDLADIAIATVAVCGECRVVKVKKSDQKPENVRADKLAKHAVKQGHRQMAQHQKDAQPVFA